MLGSRFHLDNILVIFLRFLFLAFSMYCFVGKAKKKLLLFESLKYLTQQTNTYTKLATVTPKTRCEIC